MSLPKKYYVYVFINFILYNNLTTQMMADKAETLKASANTPLAKTLMGATSSQSRVKFVKSFLYTQPIIWMNNYNNLHLKFLFFLQCTFLKNMLTMKKSYLMVNANDLFYNDT